MSVTEVHLSLLHEDVTPDLRYMCYTTCTLHVTAVHISSHNIIVKRQHSCIQWPHLFEYTPQSWQQLNPDERLLLLGHPNTSPSPCCRIKLPRGGVGRDYVVVQLTINGEGPYDFMVDSGLTAEIITPELQQHLGIRSGSRKVAGLAAGGSSAAGDLVSQLLFCTQLCC